MCEPLAMEDERVTAAARNSLETRESRKRNETPQGGKPSKFQTSSFLLCNARPFVET